jgi:hypothetical protein
MYRFPLSLALVLCLLAAAWSADDKAPEGFRPLFNGKNLTGWQVYGGNKDVWRVEDGLLVVQSPGGGWLMTRKEYADFDLRLEYKVSRGGNSGVALRSPLQGDPAYAGMEIQILDDAGHKGLQPWQHTGSIYGVVPPARDVTRPVGEWNRMRIVARGRHVTVELNGTRIVDANLDDYKDHARQHPGLLRTRGHLGLQSHSNRVEFRKLYVKPL